MDSTANLEAVFEEFESAWLRQTQPKLSEFLPPADSPHRAEALRELIRIDLEFRWRHSDDAGEPEQTRRTLHDYLAEFSELTISELTGSGLVAEEYRVRKRWGDRPNAAEFLREYGLSEEHLPLLREVDEELAAEETALHPSDPDEETLIAGEGSGGGTVELSIAMEAGESARRETFGDYELLHEIARGGMGVVYKARQTRLNRIVALKMIKSGELAGDLEIKRFLAEAEAAARLDHPNIVPIYEVGAQDGRQFFSMAFIEGHGLDAQLKQGPLPPREAANLIRKIAEAIQYAHDQGIVHRDLKPANVLIDSDGKPRITDFGLAKNIAADSGMTATGQVMGTPGYMPPEQAAARSDEIGPLADVYSLGAMLYALLTGRPPFQAASVIETLNQVLRKEPVSPRQLNPAVDKDLETICLKCLQKQPQGRYASAGELAEDLKRSLEGRSILARPLSRAHLAWRWGRRNPGIAVAFVAGIIAVLALSGFAIESSYRGELESANSQLQDANDQVRDSLDIQTQLRSDAEQARDQSRIAEDDANEAKDRIDELLYFRRINEAMTEWNNGEVLRAQSILRSCRNRWRNWEWHYLDRLFHTSHTTIHSNAGSVVKVAYSADGKKIVSLNPNGGIQLWDASTFRNTLTIPHTDVAKHALSKKSPIRELLSFSRDASQIYIAKFHYPKGNRLNVWDARTGRHLASYTNLVSFRRIGRFHLSSLAGKSGAELHDLERQTSRLLALPFAQFVTDGKGTTVVSPTGTHVAIAHPALGVSLFDTQSKTNRQLKASNSDASTATRKRPSISFNADGTRVAYELSATQFAVADVLTGKAIRTLDGRFREFGTDGAVVSFWNASRLNVADLKRGGRPVALPIQSTGNTRIAFSPNGERIAIARSDSQAIQLWNCGDQSVELLRGHTRYITSVAFAPNGETLTSASGDGTIRIWSTRGQAFTSVFSPGPDESLELLSPCGRRCLVRSKNGRISNTIYRVVDWQRRAELFNRKGVSDITFSGNGQRVAYLPWTLTARGDQRGKAFSVVDLDRGFTVATIKGDRLQLSANGHVAAAWHKNGRIDVWNVDEEKIQCTLAKTQWTGFRNRPSQVRFLTDRLLATVEKNSVTLWNTETGSPIRSISVTGSTELHTANNMLVVDNFKSSKLHFLDLLTGKLLTSDYPYKRGKLAEAIQPGGTIFASSRGGVNDEVVLWDVRTGRSIRRLSRISGEVSQISFSPDGSRLFLQSSYKKNSRIHIWDPTSGEEIIALRAPPTATRHFWVNRGRQLAILSNTIVAGHRTGQAVYMFDARSGKQ